MSKFIPASFAQLLLDKRSGKGSHSWKALGWNLKDNKCSSLFSGRIVNSDSEFNLLDWSSYSYSRKLKPLRLQQKKNSALVASRWDWVFQIVSRTAWLTSS